MAIHPCRHLAFLPGILALAALVWTGSPDPVRASGQDIGDEIFYHFMPICWRDADGDTYRFGDFAGMQASLPYLQDLGITAIWMNPVFPSPAYHGYQHGPGDQLNPWFGTEADLTAFLQDAHARGIKVFVDFVAYGISHDSVYFQDAYGDPASVYDQWLAFWNTANTDYHGSQFTTWNGDTVGQIWWDLRNPGPVGLVTAWAQHWLDPDGNGEFSDGLDGYRLDHVWQAYPTGPDGWGYHIGTFWAPWRQALRSVNPDVVVFAEQADWGSHGTELLEGMDAVFTKPFEFAARDALKWEYAGALYDQMAVTVAALQGSAYPGAFICTIGNHDVSRLASEIGDSFAKGKAAAAVLLTQPFAPNLYHGDEIGMRGVKNTSYTGDAADIPMREPFKWNAVAGPPMSNYYVLNAAAYADRVSRNNDGRSVQEQAGVPGSLLETYRDLIAARRGSVALRRGGYAPVAGSSDAVWSFVRDHAEQQVLVAINVRGSGQTFTLDLGEFEVTGGSTTPVDLLTGASFPALTDVNKGAYPLTLPAYGYVLAEVGVTAPVPAAALVDGLTIPADFGTAGLLATQDTPTDLGDNQSELNRLFWRAAEDSLFLGLTGNLATDGTGLLLLLDTVPGGQNVLDLSNQTPPPAGIDLLTGLRLDEGFAPDHLLFVNAWAGSIYVDQFALLAAGGAVKTYRGQGVVGIGNGLLTGGSNAEGMQVALDNRNRSGVTGISAAEADLAISGCEVYLPLAAIGLPGGTATGVRVAAFMLRTDGQVSSQWLPPVGGLSGGLGVAPDMTTIGGDQFVNLNPAAGIGDGPGEDRRGDAGYEFRLREGSAGDGRAVFAFRLPRSGVVSLEILDVRGRRVQTLLAGESMLGGDHERTWPHRDQEGRPVASGVYLARFRAGPFAGVQRVVVVN